MTKKTAQQSGMNVLRTLHVDGVPLHRVHVSDEYKHPKYWIERQFITKFTDFMEWYLRRHPEVDSHSDRNLARSLIYMQPGIRAWSEYMPGGFATYHVHSPHKRHMRNGRKVDPMTRALFRHSSDALGLRSRAAIMAHIAGQTVRQHEGPVEWLSVAAGSGQPTYDAARRLSKKDQRRVTLTLADISSEMMEFAEQLYAVEGLTLGAVKYELCNIVKEKERRELLKTMQPTIIDVMGLVEYLSDEQCIKVLRSFYAALAPGGSIIFTNMSPGHPHLHVHQRGLGWPGVIQRTIREVIGLMESAGIPKDRQSIYRAEDNVYNVYRVEKQ